MPVSVDPLALDRLHGSGMMRKALTGYETCVEMMNRDLNMQL